MIHGLAVLLLGFVGLVGEAEYVRPLDARALDQPALDAEGYGEKDALKREDAGLHIVLGPRRKETGWKTPDTVKFGGDFTITADLVVKKLAKPAQEDGAAVGIAIAFQDINQPDVTLVRLLEPDGSDVYRPIEKEQNNPQQAQALTQIQQMRMQMMGMGLPGKPAKPPRHTFPAAGESVRLEFRREGSDIRYQVTDGKSGKPRYLGQAHLPQAQDVAAVKLFVTNRNGAEPVDVVLKNITIRAERVTGLGTIVRTVLGRVVYADPTSLDKGILIVGGEPKTPPGAATTPGAPANAAKGSEARDKATAAPSATVASAPAAASAKPAATEATKPSAQPASAPKPAKPPEPRARIPLDEIETIHFERTLAMSARFLGQPNLDFTMPGRSYKPEAKPKTEPTHAEPTRPAEKKPEPKKGEATKPESKKGEAKKPETKKADEKKPAARKPETNEEPEDDVNAPPPGTTAPTKIARLEPRKNGIRDLHLALSNLRPSAIKQVTVTVQTAKGPTSWRLDTTDSEDWPIAVRRPGTAPVADLFLEPPPDDAFEKEFTINVSYADNQNANAKVKAESHTKADLALDTKAPSIAPLHVRAHLAGDDVVAGTFSAISDDSLQMTTRWGDKLTIPLTRVAGLQFAQLESRESADSFARRLKARGSDDILLAQTKGGEVLAIAGLLEGTDEDRLRFRYQEKTRTLPLKLVEGIILAARNESDSADELRATFSLPDGVTVSGRWKDLDTATWKVESAWGQELKLPASDVGDVRFRGGRMTYLSDLRPSKVEEVPYFGREYPWRRDTGLEGGPLKMDGRTYSHGLAVHSRTVLTYDLDGRYATLKSLVGFDDAARGLGRVDCRVLADDKEIYANPDLRATDPPARLTLPVSGARQLRLVVDFGRDQDTGDRVIWADARLYRPAPNPPNTSH